MFILKLMPFHKALSSEIVDHSKKSMNYELRTKNWCQRRLGFTLIELLIVISIIAILVTIITATFSGTQAKARDTRRKEDLDAIKKALELFKSDTTGSAKYPNTTTGSLVTNSYIKILPTDPSIIVNGGNYFYAAWQSNGSTACTGGGDIPTTASEGNCVRYTLIACLENTLDPNGVARPPSGNGSTCPNDRVYIITEP